MILFMVFGLSALSRIHSNTITSPQIRILDMATKASETRLIPHNVEYRNPFRTFARQQNGFDQSVGPLKSYVIYNDYPLIIFKEWKAANPSSDFPPPAQNYLEFIGQPISEFASGFYRHNLPPPRPAMAYRSVYSNVIRVFDDAFDNLDGSRFEGEEYAKTYRGGIRKSQPLFDYELFRPQEVRRPQPYDNLKLPENFPNIFSPNYKFHFSSFDEGVPKPPQRFYPREGYYSTHTVNYNNEYKGSSGEVEILPEEAPNQKEKKKPFLCNFIRVNQRQFPDSGGPCGRSEDDIPITLPEYPDYSNLPDHKIPVEHRRQYFHMKRIKRSERNDSYGSRVKREVGFGYSYGGWGSPFSYDSGYDGYYPNRESYRSFGNNYYSNRDRNQGYRSTYYTGGRYDEYDDSNPRGLTGYLTNGGRRYDGRRNNNEDEDEDENDEENENNRENDSDEEMERMNSNRRDANGRRGNDDSRDRRRNNSNSNNNNSNSDDDDDYRDNRRNNNRNSNSRRYNNRRNNNGRYDYNNDRNRYYSNNNGYGSYGTTWGGYGNGGYGSSYRNNGGYGYGSYGNGFGSF